jgi:hypothetical protein
MKFSQANSQVKWLNNKETNISNIISVLILRVLIMFSWAISWVKWLNGEKKTSAYQYHEDKDRDGLRNIGFFTV